MTTTAGRPIRVSIMNDYPIVVRGLGQLFEHYAKRIQLREITVKERPTAAVDVVLYDMFAAEVDALTIPPGLKPKPKGVKVVFFGSTVDIALIQHGMQHGGIDGYIHKCLPAAKIVECIERIVAGDRVIALGDAGRMTRRTLPSVGDWPGRNEGLTRREGEVLAYITMGMSNKDIATKLYLSLNSIKSIIKSAYRKIGVGGRGGAISWGVAHGFHAHAGRSYRIIYPDQTEGTVP